MKNAECRGQNWASNFKLKPVGEDIILPHNPTRRIISFAENEYSLMMSSRAVAWRSHIIDIRTMRLPRRVAPRNDRLRER